MKELFAEFAHLVLAFVAFYKIALFFETAAGSDSFIALEKQNIVAVGI